MNKGRSIEQFFLDCLILRPLSYAIKPDSIRFLEFCIPADLSPYVYERHEIKGRKRVIHWF